MEREKKSDSGCEGVKAILSKFQLKPGIRFTGFISWKIISMERNVISILEELKRSKKKCHKKYRNNV